MSSILLLICGLAFLNIFSFSDSSPSDNDDGLINVASQSEHPIGIVENLEESITKAFEGFKNVMLKGDQELGYPVMDPYTLGDVSWDYIDTSGSKKYSVKFFNKKESKIHGLSNYAIEDLRVNAEEMLVSFNLILSDVQTEIAYKLDGFMFKRMMPLYGEGVVKLSAPTQRLGITIDLDVVNGYIVVDLVNTERYDDDDTNVKVTNFMDLPGKFGDYAVDDILDRIMQRHGDIELRKFISNTVEEVVGGMTMKEFSDFLAYFVKKSDKQ
ncbi:uncharacterized protein LOC135843569 [Planococcus citri]|uniref:uncharacterized protein LOC135843569 n=1 Tax=Planococcus citri TaxID=170843 RepID=UPI0031F74662